jgi:acetyl-CoA synthetase
VFCEELPKTRSGKIMRRLLGDVSESRQLGDVTSLANADVLQEIASRVEVASMEEAEEAST